MTGDYLVNSHLPISELQVCGLATHSCACTNTITTCFLFLDAEGLVVCLTLSLLKCARSRFRLKIKLPHAGEMMNISGKKCVQAATYPITACKVFQCGDLGRNSTGKCFLFVFLMPYFIGNPFHSLSEMKLCRYITAASCLASFPNSATAKIIILLISQMKQ